MPAALSQDVMTRIANAVIAAKNVSTAEQLGWYARAIGQQPTAIQWFQTALSWDNSNEPSAYGLGVSLFTIGDKAGLAQVKQTWGTHSQRIADIGTPRDKYSRTVVPQAVAPVAGTVQPATAYSEDRQPRQKPAPRARVARPANTSSNARNCRQTVDGPMPTGGNAVSHGWCLMEMNRPLEAVKSFESALNTGTAQERSEAAYGQSLAYLRVGLVDKAAVSAIKAPMSDARQKELRVNILSDRAVAAYKAGQFRDALFILQQRSQLAPPRKDLMALQAASYLKLRRYDDARVLYEALAATGDREGIRGMAAIRDIQGIN
jgi:tetratricopeptide (TPR) repeat protein